MIDRFAMKQAAFEVKKLAARLPRSMVHNKQRLMYLVEEVEAVSENLFLEELQATAQRLRIDWKDPGARQTPPLDYARGEKEELDSVINDLWDLIKRLIADD